MMLALSNTSSNAVCNFLDKEVGRKCLARLLGTSGSRLQKQAVQRPDLRFGRREYQSKPGTYSVDAFLQVAYDSIAETLPDQFLGPCLSSPNSLAKVCEEGASCPTQT